MIDDSHNNIEYIVQVSAEVSNFTGKVLLLSPSLATPNYRSSIATIKSCQIRITTWFMNSLASSPLDCCHQTKMLSGEVGPSRSWTNKLGP